MNIQQTETKGYIILGFVCIFYTLLKTTRAGLYTNTFCSPQIKRNGAGSREMWNRGTIVLLCHIIRCHLPWSRYMCEGDVVVSDISQAGKNLCEGSNDQVLAVSET